MRRSRIVLGAIVLAALLVPAAARAATLKAIGGFESPTYVTSDPGNPNRLFVTERAGRIQLVNEGVVSTLVDLRPQVSCCDGETGLFSIALAPDFDTSGRLFVDYTGEESEPQIHVAELVANGAAASPATLREVLTIPHPGGLHHYGGQLQFGPEGDLFISTGDGDGDQGNDEPFHNAQSLASPLGKILRIDPDPVGVVPFTVPTDNPFVANPKAYAPIWSLGLRNPYRFSFDRGGAGMLIGDVGQNRREEVDFAQAPALGRGANYGWNCFEAALPGEKADDEGCAGAPASAFNPPLFEYSHGPGCAIIGGYVVHDSSLGSLEDRYLYGDVCNNELRSFELPNPGGSDRGEGVVVPGLVSFGEDSCGRVYTVSNGGQVSRLVGTLELGCATTTSKPRVASEIGIKALRRKVKRGRHAVLTVFVNPCNGRIGETVRLFRGAARAGSATLGRVCTATFRPRITSPKTFRAEIGEDATYVAAATRSLRIAIDHRKQHKRKTKRPTTG